MDVACLWTVGGSRSTWRDFTQVLGERGEFTENTENLVQARDQTQDGANKFTALESSDTSWFQGVLLI